MGTSQLKAAFTLKAVVPANKKGRRQNVSLNQESRSRYDVEKVV